MKRFVLMLLLFLLVQVSFALGDSILGKVQNSTVLTFDSLISYKLSNGVLVVKTLNDSRIYLADSTGKFEEIFSYTDLIPLDPSVRSIFQKSEYTGYESHNYTFYDSLGNVLFDIPRSKYTYDVTADGKWMFTKSVYDGGNVSIFNIESKLKKSINEIRCEVPNETIALNDSIILNVYSINLYLLDLVTLDIFIMNRVNHYNHPKWFKSAFDNSLLLSWGDTLYFINPDCEIQWKKTYGEKQQDLSVIGKWIINATASQTDAQAIIHTYDRTKHYFSLIDLLTQKETELFSFTNDSIQMINFGDLTFIDDILLMQPAYFQWDNPHFTGKKAAYMLKINQDFKSSIQSEIYSQKILFEKTAGGYRTYMRSETNHNQLLIKDWLK